TQEVLPPYRRFSGWGVGVEPRTPQNLTNIPSPQSVFPVRTGTLRNDEPMKSSGRLVGGGLSVGRSIVQMPEGTATTGVIRRALTRPWRVRVRLADVWMGESNQLPDRLR